MFEITRISHHGKRARPMIAAAFTIGAIGFFLFAQAPQAHAIEIAEIKQSLSNPPIHPAAQKAARDFLGQTLSRLIAKDPRGAARFGLTQGGIQDLEPVPLYISNVPDLMRYMMQRNRTQGGTLDPVAIIKQDKNWIRDDSGKLFVRRPMFLFTSQAGTPESGFNSWSSITVVGDTIDSWRVVQVGAPRLARAVKRYQVAGAQQAILWIPDLNRHYLVAYSQDKDTHYLTALFDDPLTGRNAGDVFEASEEFWDQLEDLYNKLKLPQRLGGQNSQVPGLAPRPQPQTP